MEEVCGGVNLLADELPPMGTWFCRVVEVDLLALDEDELPLDDEAPEDDWLGAMAGACCCTIGAGA